MARDRILSNVIALTSARGVTAILAFVTTIYLARILGPSAYGMLTWALAYFAYFRLIPDMGLGLYGVREIARSPSKVTYFVDHLISLRFLLSIVALLLFGLGLFLLDLSPTFQRVVAIQGFALFGIALSLEWVYQGVERMGVLAVRNVVVGTLTLVGVLTIVRTPDQVVIASLILAASLIAGNVWLFITYSRDFGAIRVAPRPSVWKGMLMPSLPIAISIGLVAVNINLDQLMLGLLRTTEEVGWYGAAYRVLLAVGIPAQILLQAFMPALSNSYGDRTAMRLRARLFARWLFVIGLPMAGAGIVLAPELIGVFGDEYAPAIPAFMILMIHAALQYVHMAYGNPLIAWNKQRWYMWALGVGAGVNVVANLVLIPTLGIQGAALATLLSEIAIVAAVILMHYRLSPGLYLGELSKALLITIFTVGAGALIKGLIGPGFFITAASMLSMFVLMLFLVRLLTVKQLRQALAGATS